jgi:hypothetical protein
MTLLCAREIGRETANYLREGKEIEREKERDRKRYTEGERERELMPRVPQLRLLHREAESGGGNHPALQGLSTFPPSLL